MQTRKPHTFRPTLEALEERTLLTSYTWQPPSPNTDIKYSNGNNWSPVAPAGGPGSSDFANFIGNTSNNNCTLDVAVDVGGWSVDSNFTKDFNVNNPLKIESSGTSYLG